MTETTYHRPAPQAIPKRTRLERRPTQEQQILGLLIENHPNWVPLPRILSLGISQYSARIWTLRHKRGYDIRNRLIDLPDGRKGGEFRLFSLLPDPRIADSPALVPASPTPRSRVYRKPVQSAQPCPTATAATGTAGLFADDPVWTTAEAIHREMRDRRDD